MSAKEEFLTAQEAAAMLGVSVPTLYVYVGRKGLRSQRVQGSRERRYWRADVEALQRKAPGRSPDARAGARESAITLITESGPFYRGISSIELAETSTMEEVASLLWNADPAAAFGAEPPRIPEIFPALSALIEAQGLVDRASALFASLEEANPKAFDLSPHGMARTGGDVMRWLCALVLRSNAPSAAPILDEISKANGLDPALTDLARRLLILSADHGFEPGAYAVRAVASTGVTPWRSVLTGLLVATGRRSGFGRFGSLRRFLSEVLDGADPTAAVVRRLREGEVVPGFGSHLYSGGDPRASALLESTAEALTGDPRFQRLQAVIDLMAEARNQRPDFALAAMFVSRIIRLDQGDSLFLLGRSAGWIAHSIEALSYGEAEHREGRYSGPLPN